MKKVEEIIMYDSPEAAKQITLTGWVSGGKGGYPSHYYGNDEHMARWAGCTHLKCECGGIMTKSYTKCESCRVKSAKERYMKLTFKEWDGIEYVCEYDGDKFFWDLESLQEHMCENEIDDIDLYICDPVRYDHIDTETIAGESHEDWEPSAELERKIKELNDYLGSLPPHSWVPSNVRTSYKLPEEIKKEYAE